MGARLLGEVLDHYRADVHGYTDVKKLWLLAFAFSAKDKTRTGWPGRAVMAWRTGKSASRVSHIATELVTDGMLKRAGGGGRHRGETKYVLLPLAVHPQSAPSTHSDAPVDNSGQGAARTHFRVRPQVRHLRRLLTGVMESKISQTRAREPCCRPPTPP